jgi:hypothetical protein
MGMGSGGRSIFDIISGRGRGPLGMTPEEIARLRAEGNTPLGENPDRNTPAYAPTQMSDYVNQIPQYQPTRFDANPYAAAFQEQFGQNMQTPQMPAQQPSGLGALAQLYGIYNAAPQDAASQDAHATSLAAAANTTI